MSDAIIVLRPEDARRIEAMDGAQGAAGEGLSAPHRLGLGVEDETGRLIAFLIASLTPDLADMEDVFVAPEHRRTGLATRLIGGLARHAGERGIARIGLDVSETNHAARQLYAILGFVADRVRPQYYPDGSAALVMSRPVYGFAGLGH